MCVSLWRACPWLVLLPVAAVQMACATRDTTPTSVAVAPESLSAAVLEQAAVVRANDSLLAVHIGDDLRSIAQAGVPSDATGLIGRNREWGDLYAARFQMGTGLALRVALTAQSATTAQAQAAFRGIEAGARTMEPSGLLPARLPLSISMGRSPAPVDVASGAAFYLGDACLGALALEAAPGPDQIADAERRRALRGQLAQSIRWLATQSTLLLEGDRRAPNRLLFDARAYLACGLLADDSTLRAHADPFIAAWRATLSPGGWFLEGDGWDTSYQAVSLEIGTDVAALLPENGSRSAVRDDLSRGAAWLVARVLPDGRVNSAGNTRTCGGGEDFLGSPKSLAVASVVLGLSRVAVNNAPTVDVMLLGSAGRVSSWARRNPNGDPCHEGQG